MLTVTGLTGIITNIIMEKSSVAIITTMTVSSGTVTMHHHGPDSWSPLVTDMQAEATIMGRETGRIITVNLAWFFTAAARWFRSGIGKES